VIAIDTNILIYGIQHSDGEGVHVRALFDAIRKSHAPMLLPAIVVAEYLVKFDVVDHPKQLAVLGQLGVVMPFDAKCASIAARIMQRKVGWKGEQGREVKRTIDADVKVLATAIAHGAHRLFTRDDDILRLRAMVKGLDSIGIDGIPRSSEQLSLLCPTP
jgi:predicted nucleic acid-binding protein